MPEIKCGFDSIPGGASGSEMLMTWGPTLFVNIGFDPNWNKTSLTPPIAGIQNVSALVDTGAGESCIDDLLATQLNLPIIDKRPVSGSSGQHEAIIYLAQIHIPALAYTI